MANAWSTLVGKVYRENKHKKGYKLQDAMHDAKKFWKPSGKTANNKRSRKNRKTKRHSRR